MSTEERIKQEAYSHALTNYSGTETSEYIISVSMYSHEAGALSERNKTIEQMEIILTRILSTNSHLPEVLKNLESLKV